LRRVEVARVRILLEAVASVRLSGWSGVYAGKLVYDTLSGAGVFLERGGGFRVSPLREADTGRAVVGQLLPGRRYLLEVAVWGEPGASALIQAFAVAPPRPLRVVEARAEAVELEAPEPLGWEEALEILRGGAPRLEAVVEASHGPTFYRHYAAELAYPSPRRLWSSVARRLADAAEHSGWGERPDYRPLALVLGEASELLLDKTKKFYLAITHGKRQKVFQGHARYRVAAPEGLQGAAEALIRAANVLGLGGSPGLGLGGVRAELKGWRRLVEDAEEAPPGPGEG